MTETVARLDWRCSACNGPIFGRDGYLGVTHDQIAGDGPISWTAWHDACHPDHGIGYDLSISQILTPDQVMHWTEHLSEKVWYHRSDWADVMLEHGVRVSGREWPPETPAAVSEFSWPSSS